MYIDFNIKIFSFDILSISLIFLSINSNTYLKKSINDWIYSRSLVFLYEYSYVLVIFLWIIYLNLFNILDVIRN